MGLVSTNSEALDILKLDGVGPVDNRPSTDKLHHFVQKKEEEKKGNANLHFILIRLPRWLQTLPVL